MAFLQVFQGLAGGLELDHVGNVKPLADQFQQVDVVTHRLSVLVEERIGPQVPRILVDERAFRAEADDAVGGIIGLSR